MVNSSPSSAGSFGKLHVGMLITASSVSMLVGRKIESPSGSSAPFMFEPVDDGAHDCAVGFANAAEAQVVIAAMVGSLARLPETPAGIGIASYGPLQSVGASMRNQVFLDHFAFEQSGTGGGHEPQAQKNKDNRRYGVVGTTTPHISLRGLDIYGIVRTQLNASDPDEAWEKVGVAVNTDVTCGALSEAFHSEIRDRVRMSGSAVANDDTVVFLNLAEGVGGGFVVNKAATGTANHPEMGYVTLALTSESDQAALIFAEDQASAPSILKRAKKADWKQLKEDDWSSAIDAAAQLCAIITFIISPHQIVLHGPVSRLAKTRDGQTLTFAQLVMERLNKWMSVSRGAPNGDAQQKPYVEYPEMEEADFIASSYKPRWSTSAYQDGRVDPMLYGALIYGAQVPPEIEAHSHG